ncbi:MAG: flagellar hook-length control protein FliK [Lachnotalea sp.]
MNATSVDTISLGSNQSVETSSRQASMVQGISSFSTIINSIATTSQSSITSTSNQKATSTVDSKRSESTSNSHNTTNEAIKNKTDESDSNGEENSQVDELETQEVSSNITTVEEKLNSKNSLEEASEKIKDILLDILGVSEEDLESAMQTLGLQYLDCLDKNNLAQILTQISGNSDISALITDGNLYQQFSDAVTLVDGVKDDILSELGISEDELMAVLDQFKTESLNTSSEDVVTRVNNTDTADTDEAVALVKDNILQDNTTKEPVVITEATKESVLENANVKKEDTTLKQDQVSTDVVEEVSSESDKSKTLTSNMQDNAEQQTDDQAELTTKQSDTIEVEDKVVDEFQEYSLVQEKQENVGNNLEEVVPVSEKTTVDVENILKQIQNQIKVSVNADTTTMEFQLNPEHLGKLTIQIASKEGIITAQIVAQSLTVKEVIEGQIIQLRDTMNNQGLKVQSVEVTVESHEFERNLEDGNSNANQGQFEQQQKNSRRQFNYNDLDSLEDMSVDEALIAEMMINGGNSINYSA